MGVRGCGMRAIRRGRSGGAMGRGEGGRRWGWRGFFEVGGGMRGGWGGGMGGWDG